MGELEGLDLLLHVKKNLSQWTEGAIVAEASDPVESASKEYHVGIRAFFVVLALLINVMLMNVYIGLLSSIYDKHSKRQHQLLREFRAYITWRLLTEKIATDFLLPPISCFRRKKLRDQYAACVCIYIANLHKDEGN